MSDNATYFNKGDLKVSFYPSNPVSMALFSVKAGEMQGVATVNLQASMGPTIGNETVMPRSCAFLDTNNNPGIDEYLTEIGLGEVYTRWNFVRNRNEPVVGYSGFCEYPLFQFNEEALKKIDPQGFEEYIAQYKEAFDKARAELWPELFGPEESDRQ